MEFQRTFKTDTARWSFPERTQELEKSVQDKKYKTSLLHTAAQVGNPEILIHELGISSNLELVNAVNSQGRTPLELALIKLMRESPGHEQNSRECIRLLLEAGADPRLPAKSTNALATAALLNCPATVNKLYCSIVDKEHCKFQFMLMLRRAGWSLEHMIWTGDLQMIQLFIDYKPNEITIFTTGLHKAVKARASPEVFELLLSNNLDPNGRSPITYVTPLHQMCELAREWDNYDVVEKMLSMGANPNQTIDLDNQNCLHLAAKVGVDAIVRLLLKYDMKIDTRDAKGRTAMHHAAMGGSKEVIATLHEIGLSVVDKSRSLTAETPVHLASHYSRPEAVACLIRLGADPNEKGKRDRTPLHYAVINQDSCCDETVGTLIECGANPYPLDYFNTSPLKYCVTENLIMNSTILIKHLVLEQSRNPKFTANFLNDIKDNEILKTVYNNCLAELEAMKECTVSGWASVHTILMAPIKVIKPVFRNSDAVKTMYRYIINRIIHEKFPHYSKQIINRFTLCENEQRRVTFACEGLRDLIVQWDPSGVIAEHVVKFMGDDIDPLIQHRLDIMLNNMKTK